MTKSLELSDTSAYQFEQVRRTIWVSTGEHPDNGNDRRLHRRFIQMQTSKDVEHLLWGSAVRTRRRRTCFSSRNVA